MEINIKEMTNNEVLNLFDELQSKYHAVSITGEKVYYFIDQYEYDMFTEYGKDFNSINYYIDSNESFLDKVSSKSNNINRIRGKISDLKKWKRYLKLKQLGVI